MNRLVKTLLVLVGIATMARADTPPATDLATGNTRFAFDLLGRLKDQPGNLFVSPYSLSTALAMTYAGARGETADQMAATLHFDQPPGPLSAAFAEMDRRLLAGPEPRPYSLSIANALWGQEGDQFAPEFQTLLETHYRAGLRLVDFRSSERARSRINAWVEEKTGGKIRDLLRPPSPSSDTSLLLTNAIYFRSAWASPFSKAATRDEAFRGGEGREVQVPMMHRTGRLAYLDGDAFQAVEIPYEGNRLALMVLLPKAVDGLAAFADSVSANSLSDWSGRMQPRPVDLALPRFRIETGIEVQGVLQTMGMTLAFGGDADFSGMNGRRDLAISGVVHKAFVDVDEDGTEAAAATAVTMKRMSVARPEPPVAFRADHPFLFLIRDKTTGSVLFLGRLTDPRG